MSIFKQGLFAIFLTLKPFFHIAYPMMLSLSMLGAVLGTLLLITPSDVQPYSPFITLGFTLLSTYLMMVKKHYSQILAWADNKERKVVVKIKASIH